MGTNGSVKKEHFCHHCGKGKMRVVYGTFEFTPPQNIPGGKMIIPDSMWEECEICHEILLPHILDMELEKEYKNRINTTTKRSNL